MSAARPLYAPAPRIHRRTEFRSFLRLLTVLAMVGALLFVAPAAALAEPLGHFNVEPNEDQVWGHEWSAGTLDIYVDDVLQIAAVPVNDGSDPLASAHRARFRARPSQSGLKLHAPAKFGSRQARSNGSRQACGATSWWIDFGPHDPCS